jgi:predicted alpha/beta-fold hydrolase
MKSRLPLFQALRGHFQTLLPYFFRKVALPESRHLDIVLADGDRVRAEYWLGKEEGKLVILSHGLEGSTSAVYLRALAADYLAAGWSVLAWNFRGCGGPMNLVRRLYHSGAYEDLRDVVRFAMAHFQPGRLRLAGFSLGGNLTLVFAAREAEWIRSLPLEQVAAISPPLNLAASSAKLDGWQNRPYRLRFMLDLKKKAREKEHQFPGTLDLERLAQTRSLFEFDDLVTGPMHGFAGAADYYRRCSSLYLLDQIEIPFHIVLAENDPMLARGNYGDLMQKNQRLRLHLFPEGGHCGFWNQPYFHLLDA